MCCQERCVFGQLWCTHVSASLSLSLSPQENCPGNVDVSVSVSTNELVHGPDIAVLVNMNHHGNKESPQAKLVVTPQRYVSQKLSHGCVSCHFLMFCGCGCCCYLAAPTAVKQVHPFVNTIRSMRTGVTKSRSRLWMVPVMSPRILVLLLSSLHHPVMLMMVMIAHVVDDNCAAQVPRAR